MKKIIPLILSTLLLTSCSGPDSSGGVEFSKTANVFPFGSCRGSGYQTHSTEETTCGWVTVDENNYYIMPVAKLSNADLYGAKLRDADLRDAYLRDAYLSNADLSGAYLYGARLTGADLSHANLSDASLNRADLTGADLSGADLSGAYLRHADLTGAYLAGVKANSRTICPNAYRWGTSGNDCGF